MCYSKKHPLKKERQENENRRKKIGYVMKILDFPNSMATDP
jgi:hypothetical protein